MKIALFSDIHANLPALEAFFEDLKKHGPDASYFSGGFDRLQYSANGVIYEIRKRQIPTIAGNYDQGIGSNRIISFYQMLIKRALSIDKFHQP